MTISFKLLLSLLPSAAAAGFVLAPRRAANSSPVATRLGQPSTPQQESLDSSTTNHDAFLARMQYEWKEEADRLQKYSHMVESDADLANLLDHGPILPNPRYLEHEAHRHDSLWHEVAHAIDADPDLVGVTQGEKKPNPRFMVWEAHRHHSVLDEIQHSIENDEYL